MCGWRDGFRPVVADDAAGDQLDGAGEADAFEQRAVVGDEEHRAVERVERRLELLDGRQVEVVRRLVEHEHVGAVGHQQRQRRPGALTRRQRRRRPRDVVGDEPELGQQRAGRRRRRAPVASWNARSNGVGPVSRSRACSTSPTTTLGPRATVPAASSARPSTASSSVVLPAPFAPTRAIRSPAPIDQVDRSETEAAVLHLDAVEAGHDVAAAPG